jgi:hypothetical protein
MELRGLKSYKNLEFWSSIFFLVVTFLFSLVFYIRWYSLTIFVGPYIISHWLSLTGTIIISVFTSIYYFLKRKRPQNRKILLRIHIFGNLFAFLLISAHFAQNIGRLAAIFPYLDTGVISFPILSAIVATGIFERFQTSEKWAGYIKPVHSYLPVVFFLTILFHVLHGFNII